MEKYMDLRKMEEKLKSIFSENEYDRVHFSLTKITEEKRREYGEYYPEMATHRFDIEIMGYTNINPRVTIINKKKSASS
jgi:hypothetical protein